MGFVPPLKTYFGGPGYGKWFSVQQSQCCFSKLIAFNLGQCRIRSSPRLCFSFKALFLIYINDIKKKIQLNMHLYADETIVHR